MEVILHIESKYLSLTNLGLRNPKPTSECERSMLNDSSKFRHNILMGDYSEDIIVDVPISIDGS